MSAEDPLITTDPEEKAEEEDILLGMFRLQIDGIRTIYAGLPSTPLRASDLKRCEPIRRHLDLPEAPFALLYRELKSSKVVIPDRERKAAGATSEMNSSNHVVAIGAICFVFKNIFEDSPEQEAAVVAASAKGLMEKGSYSSSHLHVPAMPAQARTKIHNPYVKPEEEEREERGPIQRPPLSYEHLQTIHTEYIRDRKYYNALPLGPGEIEDLKLLYQAFGGPKEKLDDIEAVVRFCIRVYQSFSEQSQAIPIPAAAARIRERLVEEGRKSQT